MKDVVDRRILEHCLKKLAKNYLNLNLRTVAFPLIRPMTDGVGAAVVLAMMREHLERLPINVEVYLFPDDELSAQTEY
jgi:hypothetical protein